MTAVAVHAEPEAAPTGEWKNLFGVCACLGEDFGFDPLWLRIAFGVALIPQPMITLAVYFALGAVVGISRLIAPNRRRKADAAPVTAMQPARITMDAATVAPAATELARAA